MYLSKHMNSAHDVYLKYDVTNNQKMDFNKF